MRWPFTACVGDKCMRQPTTPANGVSSQHSQEASHWSTLTTAIHTGCDNRHPDTTFNVDTGETPFNGDTGETPSNVDTGETPFNVDHSHSTFNF